MPVRQKQTQRQTVIVNVGTKPKRRAPKSRRVTRSAPAIAVQQVIPPIPLSNISMAGGPGPDFAQQFIRAMAGLGEGIQARLDRPLAPQISLNSPNIMREVQTVETTMGKAPFKAEEEGIGYMDLLGKFGRGAMSVGREALTQMGQMMTAMDEPLGAMPITMPSLGQVPMTPKPVMEPSEAEPRIVLEPQYVTSGGKGTMEEAETLKEKKTRMSAAQRAIQESASIALGVTSPLRPLERREPGKGYKVPDVLPSAGAKNVGNPLAKASKY